MIKRGFVLDNLIPLGDTSAVLGITLILYDILILGVFYWMEPFLHLCGDRVESLLSPIFKGGGNTEVHVWSIGKYSMDIFLYHILARDVILHFAVLENIWLRRILVFPMMLFAPVILRMLWHRVDKKIRKTLETEEKAEVRSQL